MSRKLAVLSFFVGACLAVDLVAGVDPAQATYPGVNGRLAIGVTSADGNTDVYTVKPGGDAFRQLTTSPLFDACPAYSPDGKTIAFCRGAGARFEIWAMKANGMQQHQVTHTGGRVLFPDYSPDTSKIVFFGLLPGDLTPDIFVVNADDGSGLVRLTTDPGLDLFPTWSPDGSKIVFVSNRTGVLQVWVMDADGSGQTRLTTDPAAEFGTAWSPDGTQIAFSRGPAGVYVMNADGTDQHPVHPAGINQLVPAWQPLPTDSTDRHEPRSLTRQRVGDADSCDSRSAMLLRTGCDVHGGLLGRWRHAAGSFRTKASGCEAEMWSNRFTARRFSCPTLMPN